MMNIVETKKIGQIDSIGRWSQNRIFDICRKILEAANKLASIAGRPGNTLKVGHDLASVLFCAESDQIFVPSGTVVGCIGILNGHLNVWIDEDLKPNEAEISYENTGIKLIFDGLELTTEGITFEKE